MAWPLSQDYNEAIQDPRNNFSDAELKTGEAIANALGIPMPRSGNFADVYEVRSKSGGRWAVKCFTRQVSGLRERYEDICRYLALAKLPFTVDFQYQERGIRVRGQWYPILKMQWVEGLLLNEFVRSNLDKPALLQGLGQIWLRMAKRLREANVGHCDLQHGNVVLVPGGTASSLAVKLIDYDGMFVPSLAGTSSGEVGHPAFQHPQRLRTGEYNLEVDRFPLLLVATALTALKAHGPALWAKYDNGDNLLFRRDDLNELRQSPLFAELKASSDPLTAALTAQMLASLAGKLNAVPLLEDLMPEARPSPSRTSSKPTVATAPAAMPATAGTEAVFGQMDDGAAVPSKRAKKERKGRKPATLALAGTAALVVVAAGVWLLAKGPSKAPDEVQIKEPPKAAASNGTKPKAARREAYIVLEIDQPGPEVLVDGRYMKVEVPGDNKPVQIKATPGMHTLRVCKKDFTDVTQNIEWKTDEAPSIRVHLEAVEKRADAKPSQSDPVSDLTEKTADGFVSLFNGKDLTGWNKKGTNAMEWKVTDSQLVGENKSNRYGSDTGGSLITERTDYGNFHLRFETMLSEGISSHIIFRQKLSDLKLGEKFAYWVLLGSVNPGARYQIPGASGTLYVNCLGGPRPLVANAPDLHLKAGEWFRQEIIAERSRLRVLINGTTVVDYVDAENPLSRGSICLNCASFCTLRCRKIEIKELPATKSEAPPATKPDAPPAANVPAEEKTFVPLFNGKKLTGWSVDGGPPGQWSVEGNTIVGQSKHFSTRNYVLTDKEYANFVLRFDYKVEDGSHGGVAIRAIEGEKLPINNSLIFDHPLIKLTNPAKEEKEPTGTTNWLKSAATYVRPLEILRLPTGVWHSMEVVVQGDNCTATVGGKKLVNVTLDPNPRNSGAITPGLGRRKGKVGFQINTGVVRYRKIEIQELPAAKSEAPAATKPDAPPAANVPAEEKAFVPLFNGKDLTGWKVNEGGKIALWGADSGVLQANGSGGGWLMTEKEYSDFELRLEFKLPEKGNSGVALRSALKGNPAADAGMEIQLLDDAWYTKNLKGMNPEGLTGAIWGIVPPSRNALKPVGEWNAMGLVAKGRNVTVVLNGTEIVNANLDAYTTKVGTHPGMQRTAGHIGLQSSDGRVEFRKIEIKVFDAAAPRPADSGLPPEAKAATKAFETSCADARAKLLAEFDTALDRLAKSKGSTEQRLKLIDAVKEEKKRFENGGLIPWSEPMRPFLAKYFASTSDAESKVRRAYNVLIDAQLRAKNENVVTGLRADLSNLRAARVMARWRSFRDGRFEILLSLYSNGRIGEIDSKNTWTYGNGTLILRFPNPMAPGGVWIATLKVSADGTMYAGTNNDRNRPKFTGVYVKED